MKHRSEKGSSLLECAAALAVAALVLASSARISQASATLLREAQASAEASDVARNLLEHEIGSPCAAPYTCPSGYRCSVQRSPVTAAADRITAAAEREDGRASQRLSSLAPAPSCGS